MKKPLASRDDASLVKIPSRARVLWSIPVRHGAVHDDRSDRDHLCEVDHGGIRMKNEDAIDLVDYRVYIVSCS